MIPWLEPGAGFPPVECALQSPNGLLAAGGDLTSTSLLDAYRHGIFPWYSDGQPILWWSPDPRMVLFPPELKVSRSLAKALRNRHYEIRYDTAFREVMLACAAPRPGQAGTWISAEMVEAYCELHRLGYAHSVETWVDGSLAGGLYGMAIGRAFFGESMFNRGRDCSKFAVVYLIERLHDEGIEMIDCQMHTAHLASLGAREIPRSEFSARLQELVHFPRKSRQWSAADPARPSQEKSLSGSSIAENGKPAE
jgi:leucyl/phenylalanyl-tRNA--protein transferase